MRACNIRYIWRATMAEQQKELTLEDVRRMTPEQKARITPEQKARLLEEKEKWLMLERLDFITYQDFRDFLAKSGYNVVGASANGSIDRAQVRFYRCDSSKIPTLVLLGPESEWGKYVDNFYCKNIIENPFVKYVSCGLTTFKIYSVVANPDYKSGWGISDVPPHKTQLEMDLSDEWITMWAEREEYYSKYVLSECARVKREIPKNIEGRKHFLAERIEQLEKETDQAIEQDNKVLDKYNRIERVIKNLKTDLQV